MLLRQCDPARRSPISSNFLVISRFVPRPALDSALGPAGEIGRPGPHRHGGVDSRVAADHWALRHYDVVAKARNVVGVIAPIVGG